MHPNGFESSFLTERFELLFLEVVDTDSIVFAVKVVLEFAVALTGEVELSEVIPAVIPEEQEAPWLHGVCYFLHYKGMFFWGNGREYKDQRVEISYLLVRNVMDYKIAYFHMHSRLEILVLFHFLLDEGDGLS
jgi:hypothetical protein